MPDQVETASSSGKSSEAASHRRVTSWLTSSIRRSATTVASQATSFHWHRSHGEPSAKVVADAPPPERQRLFRIVGTPMHFQLPTGYKQALAELLYAAALMRTTQSSERHDGIVTEQDVSWFLRSRYRIKAFALEKQHQEEENLLRFADTEALFELVKRCQLLESERSFEAWRDQAAATTPPNHDSTLILDTTVVTQRAQSPVASSRIEDEEAAPQTNKGDACADERTGHPEPETMPPTNPELDLAEIAAELFGPELWRCSLWHSRMQAAASGMRNRVSIEHTFDINDDLEVPDVAIRLAFEALAGGDEDAVLTPERLRAYMYRVGEKSLIPLVGLLFAEIGSDKCDLDTFRSLLVADYFELASIHGGRGGADGFYVTESDGVGTATYFDDCDAAFEAFTGVELERDIPISELAIIREVAESGGSVALVPGEETLLTMTDFHSGCHDAETAEPTPEASTLTPEPSSTVSSGASTPQHRKSDNDEHRLRSRGKSFAQTTSKQLRKQAQRVVDVGMRMVRDSQKVLDMVLDDARSLNYTMLVFLFFILTVVTYGIALLYVVDLAWKCSSTVCVMARVGYSWIMTLLLSVIVGLIILVPLNMVNCRLSTPMSALISAWVTIVSTFVPFFVTWFLVRINWGSSEFARLRTDLRSGPYSALMIVTTIFGGICLFYQAYLAMVQSALFRTRIPWFRSSSRWIRRPRFQRVSEQLLPWGRRKTLMLMREAISLHEKMRRAEDLGDLSVFVELGQPRENFLQYAKRKFLYACESNRLIWTGRLLEKEGIVVPARIQIAQILQVILSCASFAGLIWFATFIVNVGWVVRGTRISPTPWVVYVSFSVGAVAGLVVTLAESFMMPGNYRKLNHAYRSGRYSLVDREFMVNKNKLHRVSFVVGMSAWCTLWGFALTAIVIGGSLFLLTWSRSRVIALGIALTWLATGVISITKNTLGYWMLNRMVATQLYRRRVFAFILTDIGESAWILASGIWWVIGRVVIYLLLFALYIGRIDSNPWRKKLSVLDGFTAAFTTVALAYDAHHHPFVNRLCTLLLLRACAWRQRDSNHERTKASAKMVTPNRTGNGVASGAVAEDAASGGIPYTSPGTRAAHPPMAPIWRLLLVLALMPDMVWYRARTRIHSAMERRQVQQAEQKASPA
jgi:MFS family permease